MARGLKREDEIDRHQSDRFDPTRLQQAEQNASEQDPYNREFDDIVNNYNDSADSSQEDRNIANIRNLGERESEASTPSEKSSLYSPSSGTKKPTKLTLKNALKKGGPLGVGALLFGGAGLGLFFLSPGLLLVQMKEVFTNYGSSSSRAAIPRYNKMLQYTIGNSKVDTACDKNPTSVKCKLGTMSEAQKKAYEKAGFKFEGKDYNGRTRVTSIEFPDGHKSTSGNDFIRHTKRSMKAASAANRAYNPAVKVFNGSRYATKVLKKFGQTKANEKLNGNNNEERRESINERTGQNIDDSERESKFRAKYENEIKGKVKGASRVAGGAGIACSAYNVARAVTTAVKIENGLQFVGFAMLFLKVADQIKNNGDVDPETVAQLGAVLTSTATAGAKAGLAATDAQGYKIAAYGGEGALKKFTQAYLLGGNPALIKLDNTIKLVQDDVGKENVRRACKAATSYATAGLIAAVVCGGQVGGGAAAGTILPGAGNVGGALAGILLCVGEQIAAAVALGKVINYIIDKAIPLAIDMLKNANLDINKISGVDAGNAIAVGAGVMLGTTALSRGMKAGSKGEVTKFLADTADEQTHAEEIARYDARSEPFNIKNEYSFMGSLLRKTGIALRAPTSIGEGVTNLTTIVRSSANSFSTAQASPASMPVNITSADLSACPDRDMTDIGIDCDRMGNPQFVLSEKELDMDVGDNIDYMIDNDFIEDLSGDPRTDTDNGKLYAKWIEHCTEKREAPMGSTMMAIEETDYDWGIGENCRNDTGDGAASMTDLSNFRVFYNTLAEKEDSDYEGTEMSVSTAGDLNLNIATFNIFHSDGQPKEVWQKRLEKSMDVITSNALSVVGLQEARPNQQNELMKSDRLGGTYSIFPTSTEQPAFSPNPIIWDKAKYTLINDGTEKFPIKYGGTIIAHGVQVKLKDSSTGATFYVLNTHDPANVQNGTNTIRADNSRTYVERIKRLSAEGLPILLTGDFNSQYNEGPHCIISSSGVIKDAWEIYKNIQGCASTRPLGSKIDRIYMSPDGSVEKMWIAENGFNKNGSDNHSTIMATVNFSTGENGRGDGSVTWPVDRKHWTENKQTFLKPHNGAGTFTSPGTDGVAVDLSLPRGTPVYAIAGGNVVKRPLGRSSRICVGNPNGDNNGGLEIASEVKGGTLYIAYAHGYNVTTKNTVNTGEQIMLTGEVGNACSPHIHIDMSYNEKNICPQDVFLALSRNQEVDWASLTAKASAGCGRL